MRIRSVKPEFWTDEGLASISVEAQLLAVGLLNYADDEGYFRANPSLVKGAVFPIRFADDSTSVRRALDECSRIGYIETCVGTDGSAIGRVVNFTKHQKIDRPSPSRLRPLCASFDDPSTSPRRALDDHSLPDQGSGIRDQGSVPPLAPPRGGGMVRKLGRGRTELLGPPPDICRKCGRAFPQGEECGCQGKEATR